MADSFYDAPRRGNRDWPDMRLADGVAPLNRIYNDSVTVSADLVRRFVKEERAVREVVVCVPVVDEVVRMVLEGGFELVLNGTREVVGGAAKTLVVDVWGCDTGEKVAVELARAVSGWLPVFVAVAKEDAVGIYNSVGAGAVVRLHRMMGDAEEAVVWTKRAEEVGIMRPGLPPDCLVGSYHPQCAYLMLVAVKLVNATDTHATFSRTWQVDLVRLGEEEAVDVEAMLRMGATKAQTLEKSQPPPRQFLPWVRTITETQKAPVTATAEARTELMGASVNEDSLAASTRTETRQEWGEPYELVNADMDQDTGTVRETRQEVVCAGTAATGTNALGQYTTVQQVDNLWAIRTTVQAAGLAGSAVNGVATRTYGYRDNYSWPRVLNYIEIQPVTTDAGNIYSRVERYAWRPVWLSEGYDGPCDYTVVERWTLKKPVVDGSEQWTTQSEPNVSPKLPTETPMVKREIQFSGAELSIFIPMCLHAGVWIRDSTFVQRYPASRPMRWPKTLLARVTLNPDQGGWLTRMYFVNAPDAEGTGSGIDLRQSDEGATTFTLKWTDGEGETLLDVAASPSFDSAFLPGYRDCVVGEGAAVEKEVTGAERGVIYYARIRRGGLTSNTCVCTTKPQGELAVSVAGQPLASGAGQFLGQVVPGESGGVELSVMNAGLRMLSEMGVSLSGEDADMFTVGLLPGKLEPGATAVLEVRYEPTAGGNHAAVLETTSNAEGSPFLLELTGVGAMGEIRVEQPAGSELEMGAVVDFGDVPESSVGRVFKVVNAGNATLRGLGLRLTGAEDFTVTAELPVTELEAGEEALFEVTFEPLMSEDAEGLRTAVLEVASDDGDENPFVINLAGTSVNPTAAGTVDDGYAPMVDGEVKAMAVQADGKVVIGGTFTQVGGVARSRCARLNADGTLDVDFNPVCNDAVLALAVLADGHLLLGGQFTTVGGEDAMRLVRLEADGSVDASFTPVLNGEVRALGSLADGKVMAGGAFTTVNGASKMYLARLNAEGTVDGAFSTEVNGPVNGLMVLEDGKLLVTGDWPGVYPVPGCTNPLANNYDPGATVDDGSCTFDPVVVYGCTDSTANNYDPSATEDDGSCTYDPVYGCTDSSATNFDPGATVDDGSCVYPVYGCTDSTATNYDPSATVDDGSCVYPVYGCTDPDASNYNPDATEDDGSCEYEPPPVTYGCTDPEALNYDPGATESDGSCEYDP
ncbi:putative delta-60 repeat protein [Prosthecobacter fusiformis]|uniref:Putative delta-60 repeat protein n=1 Tax=Prosthecobacter fusiformis TaxID=48464 RepID=A0A4R7RLA6_9BACT|nr:choice-of-anchor D domain-containing protein [Prosthecobacter fusiformis]TDU62478.1 putative delta-60 repeat protein [Prosthecobacter fusiformis]